MSSKISLNMISPSLVFENVTLESLHFMQICARDKLLTLFLSRLLTPLTPDFSIVWAFIHREDH